MSAHNPGVELEVLTRQLRHSYDAHPRDDDYSLAYCPPNFDADGPELDGTRIPNSNRWQEFTNIAPAMELPHAFGSFVCQTALGN